MKQGWIILGIIALVVFVLINFSLLQSENREVDKAREACKGLSVNEKCQIDGTEGACFECNLGVICQTRDMSP